MAFINNLKDKIRSSNPNDFDALFYNGVEQYNQVGYPKSCWLFSEATLYNYYNNLS